MNHNHHHHNNNYKSRFAPKVSGHHPPPPPPPPPLNQPNTNDHNNGHRRRHHYLSHHYDATTATSTTPFHIRPRAVSFGNPALETYHGYVYTIERRSDTEENEDNTNHSVSLFQLLQSPHRPLMEGNDDDDDDDDDNDVVEVRNMAAMVQVPPNQVPDGMLHVAVSHRPYIQQVRIMIDDDNHDNDASDRTSHHDERFEEEKTETGMTTTTTVTAAKQSHAERTYLVLFELGNEEQVYQFVNDLHGQPYTYLDDSITCQVYHVLAWKGISCGSSVMSSPLLLDHNVTSPSHTIPPTTTSTATTATMPLAAVNSENNNNKTVEGYNCAVCLEGMEFDRAGDDEHFEESKSILTTVCNHTFHIDCLAQWQDSPCPVCRYDHSGLNDEAILSQCHVCSTTHNNYVCLICGIVSCGGGIDNRQSTATSASASVEANTNTNAASMNRQQYTSTGDSSSCHDSSDNFEMAMMQQRQRYQIVPTSHAWKHYNETLHAYALCTETQHVWDFAGQGYVHRLLQNKDDGKLVEVHDPTNTTSQERSSSPGLTQAQEGEVVHRKLESFASQYYTLLKSQLEQQRIYYEGRLEEVRRDYSNSTTTHQAPKKCVDTAADLIVALKQERQQLTQRLETIQSKCRKVNGDVTFLKSLNESLEANRESFRRQLEGAERERAESRKVIEESLPPLQEKVTLLMLQLESASNITSSGHEETM